MAKNDYVIVKSEIGGKLVEDRIDVKQAGGSLEVKTDREGTRVTLLNRNDRPTGRQFTYFPGSVRSIESNLSSDE